MPVTVNISAKKPNENNPPEYVYHWDRIVAVGALSLCLLIVLGYGVWTLPQPSTSASQPPAALMPQNTIKDSQPDSVKPQDSIAKVAVADQPVEQKTPAEPASLTSAVNPIGVTQTPQIQSESELQDVSQGCCRLRPTSTVPQARAIDFGCEFPDTGQGS